MRKTFDVVRRQTALILPSSASVFWGWTQDAGTQRGNRLGYPRQWSAGRHLYRPIPFPWSWPKTDRDRQRDTAEATARSPSADRPRDRR